MLNGFKNKLDNFLFEPDDALLISVLTVDFVVDSVLIVDFVSKYLQLIFVKIRSYRLYLLSFNYIRNNTNTNTKYILVCIWYISFLISHCQACLYVLLYISPIDNGNGSMYIRQ